ncbi:hypothetical protein V2J09_008392 [Rumex salicifolius]
MATSVMKFDIEKFDGKISFEIWRVQMQAVLTQHGLKKALLGKNSEKSHDGKNSRKSRSKCRPKNTHKSYKYCKKQGHEIAECFKLKNKKLKEDSNQDKSSEKSEASVAANDSEGDVFLAFDLDDKAKNEWILDTGCTFHMCPHKEWFTSLEPVESGIVYMGNNTQCKVLGKGDLNLRTHDGMIRTLTGVRYIPGLKRNLISLGTLEALGHRHSAENGSLKVCKGAMVILKANRKGGNGFRLGIDHCSTTNV